ncbi:MAG: DUF1254 domain-containing protein [Roseiarcus sp.]
MKPTRRHVLASGAAVGAAMLAMPASLQAQSADDVYKAARAAYIFGWPLLMSEATARISTSVPAPTPAAYAPFNQLGKSLATFKAGFKDVVTVNTEVLFGSAFLDLSGGPMVLSVPDMGDRFWIAQILDWWSENIESAGSRVTGQKPQKVLVVGPGWNGKTPDGMILRRTPTSNAWLLPRIRVVSNDPDDVAKAGALLSAMTLEPLTPPRLDVPGRKPFSAAPPVEQVKALDGVTFFAALAQSMTANPPHRADAAMIGVLGEIGIAPGQPFDLERLTPNARDPINRAAADGMKDLAAKAAKGWSDTSVNGWSMPVTKGDAVPGRFGTDYELRAVLAYSAFAVNAPEDAVYPNLRVDSEGAPLDGGRAYVMRFAGDQAPPVGPNGFWSLTLYDGDQFLVDNPLDRYALTGESALKKNGDGSFDIFIQAADPGGDRSSNWLPSPANRPFNLTLRVYVPGASVLDGSWAPPPARRA